jgi:hypothetical protein
MTTETYRICQVEVTLKEGITITAEVSSIEAVQKLLSDVKQANIGSNGFGAARRDTLPLQDDNRSIPSSPLAKMEVRAGLETGKLKSSLVAFKDEIPQLLTPKIFGNNTDAVLVLLYAIEAGLGRTQILYDDFKDVFELQNLKTGSPLAMILTNLRNAGYLDKKAHLDGRNLRLTAKGEQKAIEVIGALT